ncbi:4-(cytidine 5'-diphospho)-2-C-methyl-D-erythritol kinase [Consotaella aegiceratis]|uniref:4-(cytidine 5'-diphospho)-2-C-methyl-D-erythritol kinase n=1 Tax=Consotaella aegiceratis TaxID=3097961 RepID=UPI002F420C42
MSAVDPTRSAERQGFAPAKVNLALHVTGRRADGFHELDSLVAFAEHGDRLAVAPSACDRLTLIGPFAPALDGVAADNLVMRALDLARHCAATRGTRIGPLSITLEKRLPVAAGLGGGSADAAALLALLAEADPGLRDDLASACLGLGADVPMCLAGHPARVQGVGEIGQALPAFPRVPVVLVNPGVPVATPEVFRRLVKRQNAPLPSVAGGWPTIESLVAYLAGARNDLEEPALSIAPAIDEARKALTEAGALLSRMSGSGATIFGLFATKDAAHDAATAIGAEHPHWWVLPSTLRGTG